MGAEHGHKLHFHGHSWLHRAPAHLKLLALLAFMLIVVATPKEWFAVFAVYFALLVVLVATSRVPPTYLAKRMVVEIPFVVFALLLPFVATGPRVEVLGLSLSEHGPPRRVGPAGQGHPRRPGQPAARRDDRAAAPAGRARAAARARSCSCRSWAS